MVINWESFFFYAFSQLRRVIFKGCIQGRGHCEGLLRAKHVELFSNNNKLKKKRGQIVVDERTRDSVELVVLVVWLLLLLWAAQM